MLPHDAWMHDYILQKNDSTKHKQLPRLDSNTDSVTLNNTYLNNVKIFNKLFKKDQPRNRKFDSYTDLESGVILRRLDSNIESKSSNLTI